jgi:hypothetical protein
MTWHRRVTHFHFHSDETYSNLSSKAHSLILTVEFYELGFKSNKRFLYENNIRICFVRMKMKMCDTTMSCHNTNNGFSKPWNSCVSSEGKNTFNTKTSFLGYLNMSCLIKKTHQPTVSHWQTALSHNVDISRVHDLTPIWGLSWSWMYATWIYNCLCNQCLSPQTFRVRIPLIARCTRYNIMWIY